MSQGATATMGRAKLPEEGYVDIPIPLRDNLIVEFTKGLDREREEIGVAGDGSAILAPSQRDLENYSPEGSQTFSQSFEKRFMVYALVIYAGPDSRSVSRGDLVLVPDNEGNAIDKGRPEIRVFPESSAVAHFPKK